MTMHDDTETADDTNPELQSEVDQAVADAATAEHASRLTRAFASWQTIVEYKKTESKRINEKLAARIAQFNEAMNVGHSTPGDQILKLSVVEQRWQELEETRDEKKEVMAALREQLKGAVQKIKDLIEIKNDDGSVAMEDEEGKSNQLGLFDKGDDEEAA